MPGTVSSRWCCDGEETAWGNKTEHSGVGWWRLSSDETAILFGKFVLVGKHSIAAIDVAPSERLRGLLNEVLSYLWLVGHRSVKPGFRQTIGRVMHPGRTGDSVAFAQIFH